MTNTENQDALAEIKEKFEGYWKVDRSEHFEDFLREVGVNFMIRKMAGMAKPASEIRVFDGKIHIYTLAMGLFKSEDAFALNVEFEREHQGLKQKAIATYEDGKIILNLTPLDNSVKPQKTTREIVGDELLMTMYIGDVVCKRYMKRTKEKPKEEDSGTSV